MNRLHRVSNWCGNQWWEVKHAVKEARRRDAIEFWITVIGGSLIAVLLVLLVLAIIFAKTYG